MSWSVLIKMDLLTYPVAMASDSYKIVLYSVPYVMPKEAYEHNDSIFQQIKSYIIIYQCTRK